MANPSTDWKEQTTPNDDARYAGFADTLERIQKQRNEKWGKGRALHRKQLVAARGTLEVLDGLPDYARQGIFAEPGRKEAWVRLSNGSLDRASDITPDIRGFALKVRGIQGEAALGGTCNSQDFLMIQLPTFGLLPAEVFLGLTEASSRGILAVIWFFISTFGFFGGLSALIALDKGLKTPFSGFATETFYTVAPICNGPYAMKLRLVPEKQEKPTGSVKDLGAQFMEHLAAGPLSYRLEAQFFTEESVTPLENISVAWPETAAPFIPVARLTLEKQGVDAALGQEVEAAHFDPWGGLLSHRPLGDIMRARKVAYFRSQGNRKS